MWHVCSTHDGVENIVINARAHLHMCSGEGSLPAGNVVIHVPTRSMSCGVTELETQLKAAHSKMSKNNCVAAGRSCPAARSITFWLFWHFCSLRFVQRRMRNINKSNGLMLILSSWLMNSVCNITGHARQLLFPL